jgi:hypothetical protein
MSQEIRWTIVGIFFLAVFAEIVTREESWELTQTSHGIIPQGHGAVYEMLMQLGLGVGRSYENERSLPETATVWWIEPNELCRGAGDGPLEVDHSGVWRATDWIAGGGTGVVFLPSHPLDCLAEGLLAGEPVPVRAFDVGDEDPENGVPADKALDGDTLGEELHEEPLGLTTMIGKILRQPRTLAEMPMSRFRDTMNYEVLVTDEESGPFVVSRKIGKGQLVLVASALPLRNASLREADAAPFVVDLALAFGSPLIDEREHGLLPRPLPIPFLARSAAMPAIGGVVLLGALLIWRARAETPPRLEPDQPAPPTLDAYIGSVANLYRGTRDHIEVLRAYQEFALSQLRRSLRLPPDASREHLQNRLRSFGGVNPGDLESLLNEPACSRRSELLRATSQIDQILERLVR